MKKVIFLIICFVTAALAQQSFAQTEAPTEEKKNKVIMTITDGGKTVVADVNSVNVSVSRYEDSFGEEQVPEIKPAGTDTGKVKLPKVVANRAGSISYLTIEAKSLSP